MQTQLTRLAPLLDIPYIRRVRRNHGLEHATIHLLSKRVSGLKMVGRSDARGFWLYGSVETETIEKAVADALARMQKGEHRLAIHPNCGTNLVTTAMLGGAATMVALIGSEKEKNGKFQRLPLVMVGLMAATIFGQPLGLQLQEHVTTLGEQADQEVISIRRVVRGNIISHRVDTHSS